MERLTGQLTFYGVCFPRLRPLVSSLYATAAMARRWGRRFAQPSKHARADAAAIAKALRASPATGFDEFYLDPWSCDQVAAVDASGPDGCGGFSVSGNFWFHCPWPEGFKTGDDHISTCLQEMVTVGVLVERAREGSSLAGWTDSETRKNAFGQGGA